MKKLIFVISFVVFSSFLFGFTAQDAKAVTLSELQAQIQQLMTQIVALQQQLSQLQPKPIDWCHTFNANLGVGNRGPEVTALQTALQKEGLYQRTISGNFDEYTASIVVAFQEKYTSEILAPWRLVRGTGYVGSSTRAKLNSIYNCNIIRLPIVVNYVQSPAQERNILRPGERAHVYGSNLSVGTGDVIYVRMIGKAEDRKMRAYNVSRNNVDFTIPSVDAGEYDLFVERGGTQSNKIKVKVTSDPVTPSISVKSPRQGDVWTFGTQQFISWDSIGINKLVIYLWFPDGATCLLADNVSASLGRYAISVLENLRCSNIARNITAGNQYRIRIISIDDPALELAAPRASSGYFSIVSVTPVCTDSDSGKNYYQKGTVIYDEKGYTDYCLGAFYLREYFCLPQSSIGLGGVAYEDIVCPNNYSCRDGACVPPESPPSITSISPAFGVINDTITIYGKNLIGTKPSGIIVEFLEGGVVRGTISSPITEGGTYLNFLLSGIFVGMQGPGTYQVRVVNDYGKSNAVSFTIKDEEILVSGHDFYVKTSDTGTGNWSFAKDACQALGSGWTLPTMTQLRILYQKKNEIGGFKDTAYWSSDMGMYISFSNGFESSMNPAMTFPSFRCVRKTDTLGLKIMENQLASLSVAISNLIDQLRGLIGR